jgi:hypothetical protein
MLGGIVVIVLPGAQLTVAKLLQLENEPLPIAVTVAGIVTLVKPDSENAPLPNVVTEDGIVTEVIFVH